MTKYEKVKKLAKLGKYHLTFDAVYKLISDTLKKQLSVKQLAGLVDTIFYVHMSGEKKEGEV